MLMKRWISVVLSLVVLCAIVAGCGSKDAAKPEPAKPETAKAEPAKLKIAFSTWIGYGPLFIAQDQGYFEKYGVKPELTIMEDESQFANAMFSNSIQGLCHVIDREVISFSKDIPETLAYVLDESSGGDGIIAAKEIQSVKDLKGKTVGLDKSSTSYFFFLTALEGSGLTEQDIKVQDMSAADAGAAFVAGKLDAAVVWEPWLSNATKREGGHSILTSEQLSKTIVDCLTLRTDFVKAHPEAAKGLVQAWYDAIEFYKKNPAKGNEIMAKGLNLPVSDVEAMVKGVKFFDQAGNKEFFDKGTKNNIYEVVDRAGSFWVKRNIIPKEIKATEFVSSELYKGK